MARKPTKEKARAGKVTPAREGSAEPQASERAGEHAKARRLPLGIEPEGMRMGVGIAMLGLLLTLFVLGGLFKGAGQYANDDLLNALAELGQVETAIRGDMATEALTVWFSKILR